MTVAQADHKRIVPVLYRECELHGAFKYALLNKHYIDFVKYRVRRCCRASGDPPRTVRRVACAKEGRPRSRARGRQDGVHARRRTHLTHRRDDKRDDDRPSETHGSSRTQAPDDTTEENGDEPNGEWTRLANGRARRRRNRPARRGRRAGHRDDERINAVGAGPCGGSRRRMGRCHDAAGLRRGGTHRPIPPG